MKLNRLVPAVLSFLFSFGGVAPAMAQKKEAPARSHGGAAYIPSAKELQAGKQAVVVHPAGINVMGLLPGSRGEVPYNVFIGATKEPDGSIKMQPSAHILSIGNMRVEPVGGGVVITRYVNKRTADVAVVDPARQTLRAYECELSAVSPDVRGPCKEVQIPNKDPAFLMRQIGEAMDMLRDFNAVAAEYVQQAAPELGRMPLLKPEAGNQMLRNLRTPAGRGLGASGIALP